MWGQMKIGVVLALVGATVAVLGAAGVALYRTGYTSGSQSVSAQWEAERAATAKAHAQQLVRARDAQIALAAQIDQQRREADREKARILALHRDALERLRDRPERPSPATVSDPTGVAAPTRGCTGADLYREDAAVALGIARDADLLRADYHECRARYQAAKERLDALNASATAQDSLKPKQ